MATLTTAVLGERAKGAFGPATTQAVDQDALQILRGDQFIIDATQSFVGGCGDERLDAGSSRLLLPPVFGGWFAVVLADALTTRLWYREGMSAQEHALAMTEAVQSMKTGAQLCVHTDEHSLGSQECGCAAIAKAATVLGLLVDEFSDLIDSRFRSQIITNAHDLLESGYFQTGTAHFVDELEKHGVHKEVLTGNHEGVAFVINDDEGKIYDRPAFYTWCRENQVPTTFFFEYSRWSARATARKLTPTASAAEMFFSAIDCFNRAVPFAICNPNTVVIKRINA